MFSDRYVTMSKKVTKQKVVHVKGHCSASQTIQAPQSFEEKEIVRKRDTLHNFFLFHIFKNKKKC